MAPDQQTMITTDQKWLEAALSGMMTALRQTGLLRQVFAELNRTDCGITDKELLKWFKAHSQRDLRPNPSRR